jgi:ribosomal protein L34E
MRWHRQHGCYTPERVLASRGACSLEGCGQPVHANGLCRAHSIRQWRHGDTSVNKKRPFGSATCAQCFAPRIRGDGSARDLCVRCYQNVYYHENLHAERARRNSRRRNSRRRYLVERTPAWADREAIRRIYVMCPKGYEVDHIIPIRGRRVSGLHVESNLQYLTNTENKRKLNSFDSR